MSDLLENLAQVGFPVVSVDELRTSGLRYTAAVPVLLEGLVRETDPRKKEGLVRALSVPWARPAAIAPLIEEFKALPVAEELDAAHFTRWAIGNALWVLWDDDYFDDVVSLARDTRFGRSREMVVLGFEKSKRREEATEFLLTLVGDPDVEGHAIAALAKLAQPSARGALEEATWHEKTWVRNAAKRGVAKLDRLGR